MEMALGRAVYSRRPIVTLVRSNAPMTARTALSGCRERGHRVAFVIAERIGFGRSNAGPRRVLLGIY
jgi:hypothetical protein